MKLLLFLNNDIHSASALRFLERDFLSHEVRIVLSRQVGKVDGLPSEILEMKRCEYFEIEKNFSYSCSFFDDINSPEALQDLRNFAPDLMISIRFGQILKPALIAIPRCGVLNLHSGILPQYRGVMASFWAILRGEKNLGTTLHFINDGTIDTGEIIAFSHSEIDRDSSLLLNINNLYKNGCALISEVLEKISCDEKITTIDQKSLPAGQYFSYPKQKEVRDFLQLMTLY